MRRIMLTSVLAILVIAATPGVAAAQDIPTCINDSHREEAGTVEVDLRFDDRTGTFSTLTMWWFIDDDAGRPGIDLLPRSA